MQTEEGRMTPDEAQAVIALWSQRQWERQYWPSTADIAEGLEISVADAEALLREVRIVSPGLARPGYSKTQSPSGATDKPFVNGSSASEGLSPNTPINPSPPFQGRVKALHLTTAIAGLTGFFCLFLSRLLS